MAWHRLRGAIPVDEHGAALHRRVGTERQQRLIAVSCLSHERPDDTLERMVVIAWPGPGNSGHDVEPWHADCLRDVRLVLPEKAPQHCREPDLQPPPHCRVRVVLVVPELVRELLALHREGDRDDDLRESPAVPVTGDTARVAEPVSGIDRPPADGTHAAARREDRDEMVAVRLAELEDRCHGRSGPDEFRRLRREPLQPGEHVVGGLDDGDTGTLCVVACPVVLEQAAHEEHVAAMLEGEPRLHAGSRCGMQPRRRPSRARNRSSPRCAWGMTPWSAASRAGTARSPGPSPRSPPAGRRSAAGTPGRCPCR